MKMFGRFLLWTAGVALSTAGFAASDAAPTAMALIEARCQSCHNDQTHSGGLSLSSEAGLRKGGDLGSVVATGKPDQSLLLKLVKGGPPRMPAAGPPLTSLEVETIRQWIVEGARWTEPEVWWSFKSLKRPALPLIRSSWIRTPIDAFVFAKMRERGLTPAKEADRRTLIRRLTFDLHGLPPTIEEVEEFEADKSPNAYEKLVDRLLASPRYGERWGRHWLDVVHYGESHGFDKDKPRRHAWPYRDYVIQAFNDDKPYPRFIQEQLAGDALYPDDPQATVALGFIATGPWDFVGQAELREGTMDKNLTRTLDRDDMVATTMSSFVSVTAHCARCHDHKFDPIKQEEYYNLQSVFAGVDRADRPFDSDPTAFRERTALMAQRRGLSVKLRPVEDEASEIKTPDIEALDKHITEWKEISATDPAKRPPEIQQKIVEGTARRNELWKAAIPPEMAAKLADLRGQIATVDQRLNKLPKPQYVYAAADYFEPIGSFRFASEPRTVNLLQRGAVDHPLSVSHPGALRCVPGLKSQFEIPLDASESQRRVALAKWITDRNNMLTWRSIANRIWHYHFGGGIVDTPNDFGHMGSQPTNPELLDWLAVEFRDNGGSFKKLHKLVLMSAVYREASDMNDSNAKIDGGNQYWWRFNRQRLDAESLRDSLVMAAGRLDLTMGGPSVEQFFFKDDHSPVYDYARFHPDEPGNYRRSIYRFLVRSMPDPLMERFDCPDISLITAKRNTTITAIQALALMNNPFVLRQAENLAARAKAEHGR
jgi:mono/diheme cytochrome c family protein